MIKSLTGSGKLSKSFKNRTKEPLPVELQLGGNSLTFTEDGWKISSKDNDKFAYENSRLKEELSALKGEMKVMQAKLRQTSEEGNMVRFQNQLLLEMLAVSRVDEKEFKLRLRREEVRHSELCGELEQALSKIVHTDMSSRRH
jgi:hypothetical protein